MERPPAGWILSLGEELLTGRVVDRNAPWLADRLLRMGVTVEGLNTLGDSPGELAAFLDGLNPFPRLLISTGGLGPTADDRVRHEVAGLLGVGLVDATEESVASLDTLWQTQHSNPAPEHFLDQARVPEGARPLRNRAGTAWGFSVSLPAGGRLFCLPGPPAECRSAFLDGGAEDEIQESQRDGEAILQGLFHTSGVPEAVVEEKIRDLMEAGGNPSMGITAHGKQVTVSVLAKDEPGGEGAESILEARAAELRERLGDLLWGRDDETLEGVVVRELSLRGQTLATAESCTGGRLASAVTSVPGASVVFRRGWVTYADEAKVEELGVSIETLQAQGAVSEETARAMAEGARDKASADWALAVTGIAGPDGGSSDKPVGQVWLALAGPNGSWAVERMQWVRGGRLAIQDGSVRDCLEILRRELAGLPRLAERPANRVARLPGDA
jgi:nicotinamide-nucleotide amidase